MVFSTCGPLSFLLELCVFEGFSPPPGSWKKWNLSRLEPKVHTKTADDGPTLVGKVKPTKTDGTVVVANRVTEATHIIRRKSTHFDDFTQLPKKNYM